MPYDLKLCPQEKIDPTAIGSCTITFSITIASNSATNCNEYVRDVLLIHKHRCIVCASYYTDRKATFEVYFGKYHLY